MIALVRDTPNWQRDIRQLVDRLDDGDTLIVPHERARVFAQQLAAQHGKASCLWFCEVSPTPPPTRSR